MPAPQSRLLAILVIAIFVLSACNMPNRSKPDESGAGVIFTAAAKTVEAQLTQISQPAPTSGIHTPVPSEFPSRTPSPVIASQTPLAGTTAPVATREALCDQAKFIKDVTYPDNSLVSPGEQFVKTWRLKNVGTCTWTSGYSLVFSGGNRMGAPDTLPLDSAPVSPGNKTYISITFQAPKNSGTYRSEWKLRNDANQTFGIGPKAEPFWVQVKVVASGD